MNKTLAAQLCSVVAQYRWRYLTAFSVVLCANVLLILNPLVFRYAVTLLDVTVEADAGMLAPLLKTLRGGTFGSVWTWGAILLALATGSAYFMYAMRMSFAVSRSAEEDLRAQLFRRLQDHSQSFFDRHKTGELMSRLTNDLALYREVLGPGLMYPASFVTLVVPAFFALGSISWTLALISMIPVALLPPLMLSLRRVLYRASLRVQEALADMSTLAQEDYSSVRLIKAYAAERPFSMRFRRLSKGFLRLSTRLLATQMLLYPLLRLIGKLITIALVVVAGALIASEWGELSSADVVSFMWLQSYILLPVLMLGWVLPLYQKGRGAYERMHQLYTEPLEITVESKQPHAIFQAPPRLALQGLSFAYPADGGIALDDITAEIPAGSLVGITGPPGAGKTTLFRLLHRDYAFTRGMILLDGIDIHDYPLETLRQSAVVVEQEPFLFSRTLAENIALARPGASPEAIANAAQRAQLHETVLAFPTGYETLVGERGVTLSGGQKQRAAIARALLVEAQLMLLDDIFSALDTATAAAVLQELLALKGRSTVLLTAHRVAVLDQMDWLLYLSHGKLIESGPPAELERAGGQYAALVELERLASGEVG